MTSGQPASALQCTGVCKSFARTVVADHLDLDVQPGEILALLGPSGCGKTTALRLISGFEELDSGSIAIGGRTVASAGIGAARNMPPEQRRVGMVFQDYALFPHLSVRDNVAFGLDRKHTAAADEALARVGLPGYGDRTPAQLSGGQQQRVALARALAPRPDIILLDEPFSNLDATLRSRVRGEVQCIIRDAGATAVLVTHDQEEAFSLADRVAVMLRGRIAQIGAPEEIYLRPCDRAVADFLGDVQYIPGLAHGGHVECVLGSAPLFVPHRGQVDVLVRPESLRMETGDCDGAQGVVASRQYLGHSFLMSIALDAGVFVVARTDLHDAPALGQRVCVALRGLVHVLPG